MEPLSKLMQVLLKGGGGIISPTLAKLSLNGLEDKVKKSLASISGVKYLRKNVYKTV
jgi:hypothetical protein